MSTEGFKKKLVKYTMNLELIIAVCIVFAVLAGIIVLVKYLGVIAVTDGYNIYETFKKFLSIALLLVIGVEMVLMLLSHSTSSILELVLYAITRKMLIYSETMLDLILGTVAIAIVFLIRKYLMSNKYKKQVSNEGAIISAAAPIHDLNFDSDLDIPENKGTTIGGLLCRLSEETCNPVEEGAKYTVGNVTMRILKIKDGLIEKVLLTENDDEEEKETSSH